MISALGLADSEGQFWLNSFCVIPSPPPDMAAGQGTFADPITLVLYFLLLALIWRMCHLRFSDSLLEPI